MGINRMTRVMVLGECKWGTQPIGRAVLTDLVDKTAEFVPNAGEWQVYYLGFARDGWTAQSQEFADNLTALQPTERNWRVMGIRLYDLAQVDADLCRWV